VEGVKHCVCKWELGAVVCWWWSNVHASAVGGRHCKCGIWTKGGQGGGVRAGREGSLRLCLAWACALVVTRGRCHA
jgi:hypothetical protein